MHKVRLNGHLVEAGPDSPEVAVCPSCGEEVRKRKRKTGHQTGRQTGHQEYTYFYRHRVGVGDGCSLRSRSAD